MPAGGAEFFHTRGGAGLDDPVAVAYQLGRFFGDVGFFFDLTVPELIDAIGHVEAIHEAEKP